MTPTYRLDTLAVNLIARLEPARRARAEDPNATRAAFDRVVREAARALAAECRETLGDEEQAQRIEREAVDTFLPRYTTLALRQNKLESKGFGFILGEGFIARVLTTGFALFLAAAVSRVLHHWIDVAFFVAAALTPVAPEIRRWWSRRQYRGQLQELADDMGRIQDADQALVKAPVVPSIEVTPRLPHTQKDVN